MCILVRRNLTALRKLPDPVLTGVPVVAAAELRTGMKKNPATHPDPAAKLDAFLGLFVLVDFNRDDAPRYADIRAALEAGGTAIGPQDLLIATQVAA